MQSTIDSVDYPSACASRAATYWQFPVAEKYKIIFLPPCYPAFGHFFHANAHQKSERDFAAKQASLFPDFHTKSVFFQVLFFSSMFRYAGSTFSKRTGVTKNGGDFSPPFLIIACFSCAANFHCCSSTQSAAFRRESTPGTPASSRVSRR